MKRRRAALLASVLLVGALLLLCRKAEPGSYSRSGTSAATDPEGLPSLGSAGDAGRKRSRENSAAIWRHAEEQPGPESAAPPRDFPVYLGYLQSDATNQELRIGLRQEAGASLDVDDLEVQVNLLDAGGNLLGPDTKARMEWIVDEGDFPESQAPSMRVSSQRRIDGVELILRYQGEEVERRRYVLAPVEPGAGSPAREPEIGGR